MSKNIYIEAGVCRLSMSMVPFYEEHKEENWEYHLFEPNSLNLEHIKEEFIHYNIPNLKIYDKAVWNEDCEKDIWMGRGGRRWGSSLFSGKGFLGTEQTKVNCIDFGKWIRDNIEKEDYIHLRMDIEGSEYTVLPSMIKDKSIEYINRIYVEFHAHKFRGENREIFEKTHRELREFFSNCKNIEIEELYYIEKIG